MSKVAALAFALALAGPSLAGVGGTAAVVLNTKYDAQIEEHQRRWLPLWDWRWLKAQLFQESRLRPDVCSNVGACGIAQFMPLTWGEVASELRFDRDIAARFVPELAIQAAAYYDMKLERQWKAKRTDHQRRQLVFASYNAGTGNILRAQKICVSERSLACDLWDVIKTFLPRVTGVYSGETIIYVERIEKWYSLLQQSGLSSAASQASP